MAKRIDIVRVSIVKESSYLYGDSKKSINSASDAYKASKDLFEDNDREKVMVMCLNVKNEPTNISVVSIGSLNSSVVHPREVFKTAILSNAASILLIHNHPSGDPTPSKEDLGITRRLKEAGDIIGINLLDSIVIGDNRFISLKEKGLM